MHADAERARYAALLATVDRLVRDEGAEQALAADARAWLAAGGLDATDVEQLAALGAKRLLVYRRHVRRTLRQGIRLQIPRTAARLGEAFASWIDRWVAAEAPRSRYFRDAAFELVAWAAPRWATDASAPAYLGDLARHELGWFEVASAPDDDPAAPLAEMELDRGARFSSSARLFRHAHAVHRLDAAIDARDLPARDEVALLAYRDAEGDVRYLELSRLAAEILARLLRGEALGAAVVGGCEAIGHPLDGAVTQSTAALLDDLQQRGALLGGEAGPPAGGSAHPLPGEEA